MWEKAMQEEFQSLIEKRNIIISNTTLALQNPSR